MKNLLCLLLMAPLLATAQAPTFQQEMAGNLGYSQNQIVQLIGAIPQDKFSWRPADSVRSVAEVTLHIAASTYNLASALGKALPEGLDTQALEKSTTNKDEILQYINDAFAFANAAIADVKDESMTETVELPFGTFSKRSIMMIIASHGSEHKGQLIAYTRMNGIAPPWSGGN